MTHVMSLQPGVRLGPYEINALIGAGAMGQVYRALDLRLARTVAIKVSEIRRALGEDASSPRFIRTAHRFGYAFRSAGDTKLPGAPESPPNACGCRLSWRGQRMTLGDGRHTVGRDPNVDIYLDSTSVSRRHASIRIADGQALLEDLGSKNGTFLANAGSIRSPRWPTATGFASARSS